MSVCTMQTEQRDPESDLCEWNPDGDICLLSMSLSADMIICEFKSAQVNVDKYLEAGRLTQQSLIFDILRLSSSTHWLGCYQT